MVLTIFFSKELLTITWSYFNFETKTKLDLIAYEKDINYPVITIVSRQDIIDWIYDYLTYKNEIKGKKMMKRWRFSKFNNLREDLRDALLVGL